MFHSPHWHQIIITSCIKLQPSDETAMDKDHLLTCITATGTGTSTGPGPDCTGADSLS